MEIKDSIKISFIALRANKARSALTILGIVIGIASVIIMMSLGQGAENLIVGQIARTRFILSRVRLILKKGLILWNQLWKK